MSGGGGGVGVNRKDPGGSIKKYELKLEVAKEFIHVFIESKKLYHHCKPELI